MNRHAVFTDKGVLPSGPYSQAIVLNGVAYIAGQGSFLRGTTTFQPGTFREQAELTLQNVGVLLVACGTSFAHVAKVNVYLTDLKNFPELNDIYKQYFKAPYPARTTVQTGLSGDMLIEVDCIAGIPE